MLLLQKTHQINKTTQQSKKINGAGNRMCITNWSADTESYTLKYTYGFIFSVSYNLFYYMYIAHVNMYR